MAIHHALQRGAQRGKRVRVAVPGPTDQFLAHAHPSPCISSLYPFDERTVPFVPGYPHFMIVNSINPRKLDKASKVVLYKEEPFQRHMQA